MLEGLLHLFHALRPLAGIWLYHLGDKALQFLWNVETWRHAFHLNIQGLFSCQQGLQGRAETIDVRLHGALRLAILLRSGVAWRAKRACVLRLLRSILAGNTKIDEVEASLSIHHNIGRFDIPKDDRRTACMQILQYVTEGDTDRQRLCHRKASMPYLRQQIVQRLSFNIIHDHIPMLGVGKMVIDKWQVLMSQPGKIHDLTII